MPMQPDFTELEAHKIAADGLQHAPGFEWPLSNGRRLPDSPDWEDTFRTRYPQFRLAVASDEENREAA